jgi:hypothetical protein
MTGSARDAFVERECAGDAVIRTEVERLLQARERIPGWLDQPALVGVETDGAKALARARSDTFDLILSTSCCLSFTSSSVHPIKRLRPSPVTSPTSHVTYSGAHALTGICLFHQRAGITGRQAVRLAFSGAA